MNVADEDKIKRVDQALSRWRQGDCTLGEHSFLYRLDMALPLAPASASAAQEGADVAEAEVSGFMVATQTCDIVRTCRDRPYIEACALVEVEPRMLEEIRRGRRPSYAFVPGIKAECLVADLDRVMTVEKAVVATWQRTEGCRHDQESRRLALALSRKRSRFAFPDDFVELMSGLQNRLSAKHDKHSDEGRALRALREVRVRAAPSWHSDEVDISLLFIRNDDQPQFEGKGWDYYLDAWLERVPTHGRFSSADGLVCTLDDLTAREYVESDPLDLDHLSTRESAGV